MAIRRVYYIENNKVRFHNFNIQWNGGFSIGQKQKNIDNLHKCVSEYFKISISNILEVSTKSRLELGRSLSSFNLKMKINGEIYPLECVYQSSKVFKNILGEYQVLDALKMSPKSAKNRLANEDHSTLVKFKCNDQDFPLEPKHLFYDWLYINSVIEISDLIEKLEPFQYFTDIEFNPDKSLNCQARTLVLFIWLVKNNRLEEYLKNPQRFYRNTMI